MYVPKPKIVIKPPRKKDFRLPDGSVPEPKQWIHGGRIKPNERWILNYFGRFDRMPIKDCERLVTFGKLIYIPRIYYRFELRHSVRVNGKPTPKTLKTWFIQNQDFKDTSLRAFWKTVSSDLAAFGLNRTKADRIKAKIAEHIPKVEGNERNPGIRDLVKYPLRNRQSRLIRQVVGKVSPAAGHTLRSGTFSLF